MKLRSSAPGELATFYEGLGLTFVREQHGGGPEHLTCATHGAVFEIYPERDGQTTRGTRIGFAVPDVDKSYASALASKALSVSEPRTGSWGRRAVVCDPAGHVVELTQQPD